MRIQGYGVPKSLISKPSDAALFGMEKFLTLDAIKGSGIHNWIQASSKGQLAILRMHPLHMVWILAWIRKET